MEANSRPLLRIFEPTVCYQIPLFQRPYVWKREDNWQPLWEDFERLLGVVLAGEKLSPHFLGAVVLEQLRNDTGSVQCRQVIDGQQRLTTLQLLLIAARDLCRGLGNERFAGRFESLVSNSDTMVDDPSEVRKLLPTNADRKAYALVHGAGSPDALLQQAQRRIWRSVTNRASPGLTCSSIGSSRTGCDRMLQKPMSRKKSNWMRSGPWFAMVCSWW